MKRLLSVNIFTILFLASCSDLREESLSITVETDDLFNLTFEIPDVKIQTTRSADPEYQVNDITMLIYTGEGNDIPSAQIEYFFSNAEDNSEPNKLTFLEDNRLGVTFRLDANLRKKTDLRFYFLANCSENVSEKTENELINDTYPNLVKTDETGSLFLTMSGMASLQEMRDKTIVPLYRNASKVSVSNIVPTDNPDGLKLFPYDLFGAATETSLLAGIPDIKESFGTPKAVTTFPSVITETDPRYFHPTENEESDNHIGGKCYLITKAKFGGEEYYYRLDFTSVITDDSSNEKLEYISLLPNHWYQFVILEITSAGYPTPAEAALHPENGVKYEIHDHCVESYNMISDGYRELGVSKAIEYSGLQTEDGEWSDLAVYIKFFSKYESEIPAWDNVKDSLVSIEDKSWLELSEAEPVTDEEITGGDKAGDDVNDKGTVYKMKVRFKQIDGSETLYNKVIVKWKNLERTIPVIWVRNFKGSDITTASLIIDYNENKTEISDYWGFLSSTDDPDNPVFESDNLWGIQPEVNNGKVRNDGFHFPVMYGSDENFASYSYTLIFDKGKYKDKTDYSWEIDVNGDESITDNVKVEAENSYPLTISIKREGKVNEPDYTYGTGKLKITITSGDGTKDTYSFGLYHTGFFHKNSSVAIEYQLDGHKDDSNYFYYEVVPVTVDGEFRYILDRNLSAKSAQDYIRNSDGTTVAGNPQAAGGYYVVAKQGTLYEDPIVIDNITPPGYRLPKKNAWDAIRLSSSFHTENTGRYYPSYYESENSLIGKIYFPKSMLYLGGAKLGDSRSGYYWTETPSSGTEKEEIGRWLNMFFISGNSSSFINGYVLVGSNWNQAYGASVRCINDQNDDSEIYRTSFNVSGATHVFLYTEADGVRTSTTSWPGHAIGNYATMSEPYNWFNFVFSSTQFKEESLYVIFNFVDEDGIIYSYSQDEDGKTIYRNDKSPLKTTGWKVVGNDNPRTKPADDLSLEGDVTLEPTDISALGDWWKCGINDGSEPYVNVYKVKK